MYIELDHEGSVGYFEVLIKPKSNWKLTEFLVEVCVYVYMYVMIKF